jgi:hypothetical protein
MCPNSFPFFIEQELSGERKLINEGLNAFPYGCPLHVEGLNVVREMLQKSGHFKRDISHESNWL